MADQQKSRPEPDAALGAALAWGVHAFTAIGAVLGLFALHSLLEGEWYAVLAWLFVALIIDGVDGTLARWARVQDRLPRIDGPALDLIIDYLNYVFIPALLIWRSGLVSALAAPWLASAILLSSLYVFARKDMKSGDNYFRGFPALWNIVAYYLLVLQPGHEVSAAVVILLVVASFAPIHFVHPFRVRDFGKLLPILAILWAISTAALLAPLNAATMWIVLIVSLASAGLLVAMGLVRTLRGPQSQRPSSNP
jgi:phosphatidylcholine synthase